jgi:hypothetical protein
MVPLKTTGKILGIEAHTIRNRMCGGTWPIPLVHIGGRVYFYAEDIAAYIDEKRGSTTATGAPLGRRGAPTNEEKQAARAAGLTVPSWRRKAAAAAETAQAGAAR